MLIANRVEQPGLAAARAHVALHAGRRHFVATRVRVAPDVLPDVLLPVVAQPVVAQPDVQECAARRAARRAIRRAAAWRAAARRAPIDCQKIDLLLKIKHFVTCTRLRGRRGGRGREHGVRAGGASEGARRAAMECAECAHGGGEGGGVENSVADMALFVTSWKPQLTSRCRARRGEAPRVRCSRRAPCPGTPRPLRSPPRAVCSYSTSAPSANPVVKKMEATVLASSCGGGPARGRRGRARTTACARERAAASARVVLRRRASSSVTAAAVHRACAIDDEEERSLSYRSARRRSR